MQAGMFLVLEVRCTICIYSVLQGQEQSGKDSVKSQKCFSTHRIKKVVQEAEQTMDQYIAKLQKWLTHAIIRATITKQNNMLKLKRNVRKTWEDSAEPVTCQFQNPGWKKAGNTLYKTKIYKCSHSSSCQAEWAPRAKAQLPSERGALQAS